MHGLLEGDPLSSERYCEDIQADSCFEFIAPRNLAIFLSFFTAFMTFYPLSFNGMCMFVRR